MLKQRRMIADQVAASLFEAEAAIGTSADLQRHQVERGTRRNADRCASDASDAVGLHHESLDAPSGKLTDVHMRERLVKFVEGFCAFVQENATK